jgi:hypothetical protein
MSLWLEPAVFPVLLNSCVLHLDELRDLVLEAAHRHLDRVLWADRFLQDTARTLLADGRSAPEQAARFCSAMEGAFPEPVIEPPASPRITAARWQSEQPRAG